MRRRGGLRRSFAEGLEDGREGVQTIVADGFLKKAVQECGVQLRGMGLGGELAKGIHGARGVEGDGGVFRVSEVDDGFVVKHGFEADARIDGEHASGSGKAGVDGDFVDPQGVRAGVGQRLEGEHGGAVCGVPLDDEGNAGLLGVLNDGVEGVFHRDRRVELDRFVVGQLANEEKVVVEADGEIQGRLIEDGDVEGCALLKGLEKGPGFFRDDGMDWEPGEGSAPTLGIDGDVFGEGSGFVKEDIVASGPLGAETVGEIHEVKPGGGLA